MSSALKKRKARRRARAAKQLDKKRVWREVWRIVRAKKPRALLQDVKSKANILCPEDDIECIMKWIAKRGSSIDIVGVDTPETSTKMQKVVLREALKEWEKRSPRSRAQDIRQRSKYTYSKTDVEALLKWIGSKGVGIDIEGIDTPKKEKKEKKEPKKKEERKEEEKERAEKREKEERKEEEKEEKEEAKRGEKVASLLEEAKKLAEERERTEGSREKEKASLYLGVARRPPEKYPELVEVYERIREGIESGQWSPLYLQELDIIHGFSEYNNYKLLRSMVKFLLENEGVRSEWFITLAMAPPSAYESLFAMGRSADEVAEKLAREMIREGKHLDLLNMMLAYKYLSEKKLLDKVKSNPYMLLEVSKKVKSVAASLLTKALKKVSGEKIVKIKPDMLEGVPSFILYEEARKLADSIRKILSGRDKAVVEAIVYSPNSFIDTEAYTLINEASSKKLSNLVSNLEKIKKQIDRLGLAKIAEGVLRKKLGGRKKGDKISVRIGGEELLIKPVVDKDYPYSLYFSVYTKDGKHLGSTVFTNFLTDIYGLEYRRLTDKEARELLENKIYNKVLHALDNSVVHGAIGNTNIVFLPRDFIGYGWSGEPDEVIAFTFGRDYVRVYRDGREIEKIPLRSIEGYHRLLRLLLGEKPRGELLDDVLSISNNIYYLLERYRERSGFKGRHIYSVDIVEELGRNRWVEKIVAPDGRVEYALLVARNNISSPVVAARFSEEEYKSMSKKDRKKMIEEVRKAEEYTKYLGITPAFLHSSGDGTVYAIIPRSKSYILLETRNNKVMRKKIVNSTSLLHALMELYSFTRDEYLKKRIEGAMEKIGDKLLPAIALEIIEYNKSQDYEKYLGDELAPLQTLTSPAEIVAYVDNLLSRHKFLGEKEGAYINDERTMAVLRGVKFTDIAKAEKRASKRAKLGELKEKIKKSRENTVEILGSHYRIEHLERAIKALEALGAETLTLNSYGAEGEAALVIETDKGIEIAVAPST